MVIIVTNGMTENSGRRGFGKALVSYMQPSGPVRKIRDHVRPLRIAISMKLKRGPKILPNRKRITYENHHPKS